MSLTLKLTELLKRETNLLRNGMDDSNVKTLQLRQKKIMVDIIRSYDRQLSTIKPTGNWVGLVIFRNFSAVSLNTTRFSPLSQNPKLN